jgi:hypothetical protein
VVVVVALTLAVEAALVVIEVLPAKLLISVPHTQSPLVLVALEVRPEPQQGLERVVILFLISLLLMVVVAVQGILHH